MLGWVLALVTFGVLFTAFSMCLAVEELRRIEDHLGGLVRKVVEEPEARELGREEYDKLW